MGEAPRWPLSGENAAAACLFRPPPSPPKLGGGDEAVAVGFGARRFEFGLGPGVRSSRGGARRSVMRAGESHQQHGTLRPNPFSTPPMLPSPPPPTCTHTHSVPLPAGVLHDVMRGYLLHYGYADTLAALDAAAGPAGGGRFVRCAPGRCAPWVPRCATAHPGALRPPFPQLPPPPLLPSAPTPATPHPRMRPLPTPRARSGGGGPAEASLAARRNARRLIMAGDMQGAVALLQVTGGLVGGGGASGWPGGGGKGVRLCCCWPRSPGGPPPPRPPHPNPSPPPPGLLPSGAQGQRRQRRGTAAPQLPAVHRAGQVRPQQDGGEGGFGRPGSP